MLGASGVLWSAAESPLWSVLTLWGKQQWLTKQRKGPSPLWEPRASYLHAALAVGVFYHFCLPFLPRINRFCINMLWLTRTNNTSVIFFFFLALTPSDLFKQTTPQQSWPINHLNGLKTYLMSLTNHFMKCHCSSWQDFLLHTSSLFCFTLSAPRLPCACAPSICIELWNFSVEQYSGDRLPS